MEPTTPEIVELSGGEARLGPGRSAGWLAGWLVVIVAAVGVALSGTPPPGPIEPPADAATDRGREPAEPVSSAVAQPSPGPLGERSWVSLVMPAHGDVIIASSVPIAGRVTGSGPEHGTARSATVGVEIRMRGSVIGRADLPVVAGRFAGWVDVLSPGEARMVDVLVRDPQRPGRTVFVRSFILEAPDGDLVVPAAVGG